MPGRITELEAILAEEPNDLFVHYALALEWAKVDLQTGIAKLIILIESWPAYVPAYHRLAQYYEQAGNEARALDFARNGLLHAKAQNDSWAARELQALVEELE
jgi:predicted Zn-dependent protease